MSVRYYPNRSVGASIYANFAAFPSSAADGTLAVAADSDALYVYDSDVPGWVVLASGSAAGDVIGPASATDNALARFDGSTGKLIQSSVAVLSDVGALTGLISLDVSGSATTTSFTINSASNDALTTGAIARFVSNSADASTRNLLFVRNQNTGAILTTVAEFRQDAANTCVIVTQNGAGNALVVDQNANAHGLVITSDATSNNALRFSTTLQTTGAIISVPNADSLTSASIANWVSNSASATTRSLVFMRNQNAAATAAVVFRCQQDSTASVFVLDRSATASTNGALVINDSGTGGGPSLDINQVGGGYSDNVGIIDIVRTGNFTGVDAQTGVDFRVSPAFTMTEPGAGTFKYYGGSFDISSIAVTAGAGTSILAGLFVNGNADADVGTSYSILTGPNGVFGAGNHISLLTGNAISGAAYQIGRDADGTNQLHFNVPTGATMEWSVNDTPEAVLSASSLDLVNNSLKWTSSAAVTAANFEIIRDSDATNQMHFNVPASNGYEFSINDNAVITATPGIGGVVISPLVQTTGSPLLFGVVGPAHTTLTASTEAPDLNINLNRVVQFATGNFAIQRAVRFQAPTWAAVGASIITSANNVAINSPSSGASMTFTNAIAASIGSACTLASTSGLTYSAMAVPAHTVTLTGATGVTSRGLAGVAINQITITDGSAITVDNAASCYIQGQPIAAGSVTLTNTYSLWVDAGHSRFDGRVLAAQGADIASAGDLSLGVDGNTFEITGTTTINAINVAGWTLGSMVTLIFASTPTVSHNTAGGGGTAVILLAGAANFSATAGDTLTLRYSEQGGTNAWREMARTVI